MQRINNITETGNQECVGCGACMLQCSNKSIYMEENQEGHIIAKVNVKTCINCGLCKKVCVKYETDSERLLSKGTAYYAWSKNKAVLNKSTSGGIVHEIAAKMITEGYTIIGVMYNSEKARAEHILVDKKEDLPKIIGSKYIQSYTEFALSQIDKNKKYVFIGTPCQVNGLKNYMAHNNIDNIILIDFFCHGHGGYLLWKQYIKYLADEENIKNIQNVEFRSKKNGWHKYLMHIESDYKEYFSDEKNDPFMQTFLSNTTISKPCYHCKFRKQFVSSDIRVGDFWGRRFQDNDTGVSMVIANTTHGEKILDLLDNIEIGEVNIEEALKTKADRKKVPFFRNAIIRKLKNGDSFNSILKLVKLNSIPGKVKGGLYNLLKGKA